MFFITGDLKERCSYVNRSYCETSVFTVNVIWLLLLYSCFYHALQHWFPSFFLFPILLSLNGFKRNLIGQNSFFSNCLLEWKVVLCFRDIARASLPSGSIYKCWLMYKHITMWAAETFFFMKLPHPFMLNIILSVTIINDWPTRVLKSIFLNM